MFEVFWYRIIMNISEIERRNYIEKMYKTATDIHLAFFQMQGNREIRDFLVIPSMMLLIHAAEIYLKIYVVFLSKNMSIKEYQNNSKLSIGHDFANFDKFFKNKEEFGLIWSGQKEALNYIYQEKYRKFFRVENVTNSCEKVFDNFVSHYRYFYELKENHDLPIGAIICLTEAIRQLLQPILALKGEGLKKTLNELKISKILFPEFLIYCKEKEIWEVSGKCGVFYVKTNQITT